MNDDMDVTLDEFIDVMRRAVDAYHVQESANKPGDEEYVEKALKDEWLEWFNVFLETSVEFKQ